MIYIFLLDKINVVVTSERTLPFPESKGASTI